MYDETEQGSKLRNLTSIFKFKFQIRIFYILDLIVISWSNWWFIFGPPWRTPLWGTESAEICLMWWFNGMQSVWKTRFDVGDWSHILWLWTQNLHAFILLYSTRVNSTLLNNCSLIINCIQWFVNVNDSQTHDLPHNDSPGFNVCIVTFGAKVGRVVMGQIVSGRIVILPYKIIKSL